jgi:hypothetical protein
MPADTILFRNKKTVPEIIRKIYGRKSINGKKYPLGNYFINSSTDCVLWSAGKIHAETAARTADRTGF